MSEKMVRVCIDPGHGGYTKGGDPGAVNGDYYEAKATLAIARKVGEKLTEKGYLVCFTRNKDKELSLAERCKISNDFDADCFVSIHINAATNKKAQGIESWRYQNVGSTTKKLADSVQKELIGATGAVDRGVKQTTAFYVLKKTQAPAVLVECGFISNDAECKKLFTSSYQNKIANGIVRGVVKTFPQ